MVQGSRPQVHSAQPGNKPLLDQSSNSDDILMMPSQRKQSGSHADTVFQTSGQWD